MNTGLKLDIYISPYNNPNHNYDPESLTQFIITQYYNLSVINREYIGSQYDLPYVLRLAKYVMIYYVLDRR
jgi:hypothetical protein